MIYNIIDFHTHPFFEDCNNVCNNKDVIKMNADFTAELMQKHGVSKFCGSIINCNRLQEGETRLARMKRNNDTALFLRDYYKGAYVPGFHVHPDYPDESCGEIDRMKKEGVFLMGELVPYIDEYSIKNPAFDEILTYAAKKGMMLSIHTTNNDEMDELVKKHTDLTIVAAHPGEYDIFLRHAARAKFSDNYYLDVSGTGLFRYGLLRNAIDKMGKDKILFGSDYPACNPAAFIGGVVNDELLTEKEKRAVLFENAERLFLKLQR